MEALERLSLAVLKSCKQIGQFECIIIHSRAQLFYVFVCVCVFVCFFCFFVFFNMYHRQLQNIPANNKLKKYDLPHENDDHI